MRVARSDTASTICPLLLVPLLLLLLLRLLLLLLLLLLLMGLLACCCCKQGRAFGWHDTNTHVAAVHAIIVIIINIDIIDIIDIINVTVITVVHGSCALRATLCFTRQRNARAKPLPACNRCCDCSSAAVIRPAPTAAATATAAAKSHRTPSAHVLLQLPEPVRLVPWETAAQSET